MNEHPSSPPPICAAPVVISGSGNSTTQPTMTQASTAKEAPNNLTCNGTGLMRASDLDLRKTKGELFSKLTERQPQQMIVTPALLNRRSSDENINSTSSLFKSLNRVEFTCHGGSSSNCSADTLAGSQQASGQQQQQNNSAGQHKQQKTIASSMHQQASETTSKQQQQASLMAGIKQEPPLFSRVRSKWYTNEEVASILTSYSDHPEWQSNELQLRPKSGAVLLYSREKVRYRQDGYCWKKRKNGRTTREDHMKLKVQGIECIYGCYVHSALLPTFHRRCYWLLENPDTVLVHYLNQPPDDKNKMILTFNSGLLESDTKRRWTNEEIIEEIGSVFGGISQIHRTLSINFPTTTSNNNSNNSVAVTANPLALLPGASGNNNNNSNNTSDGGCNVQQGNRQQQQQQKAQLNDGKLANGSVSLMMATNNEASDNGAKLIGSNNLGNNNNQQLGMVIINELNSQASLLQANSTISPSNDNGTNVVDKRLNTTAANDDGDDDDDVDESDDDDSDGHDEDDEIEGANDDDEMITINQDNSNSEDNYNDRRHCSTTSRRRSNRDLDQNGSGKAKESDEALIDNCGEQQQQHVDDAMTFDIVIDQPCQPPQDNAAELAGIHSSIEQGPRLPQPASQLSVATADSQGDSSGMLIYSMEESDSSGQEHQQQAAAGQQLVELDSKSFCDHQTAPEPVASGANSGEQMGNNEAAAGGPCSPVTQIYNKIVDDIETYAIPFDLNQFDPSSHHHHHHHHHHQHHQHGSNEIQSMDTSEPDQEDSSPKQLIGQQQQSAYHQTSSSSHHHHHIQQDHSPVMLMSNHLNHHQNKLDNTCHPAQLIGCDLFAQCAGLNGDSGLVSPGNERPGAGVDSCHQVVKSGTDDGSVHEHDDMLLSQFELSTTAGDTDGPAAHEEVVVTSDELSSNVDEMRDLMMGISSQNDPADETNQTNQLLLSCQDPSDPLTDLFSFKPLNCDLLKHHHHHQHHHLLDVKSTTSETDTLDRLSPITVGRQPPRCNSSDDAMQLSGQRCDQYLHHGSIHFLANTSGQTNPATHDEHQLIDNYSDYDQHQHQHQQHQLQQHHHQNDITIAYRSNASTEPSNSTSTSSLLNATSGLGGGCGSHMSGASYASAPSADQGPASSLGSNCYNESSTTASSSSFIKLPLQQRQNSEQKEPSNSVLSSLLPKALSLDGSDLSSSTTHYSGTSSVNQHHHHHHNHHQHHHHQQHHPHHQHHHGHHNPTHGHQHHHHHNHHQRASPLVGPYHTGGSGGSHTRAGTTNHQSGLRSAGYTSSSGAQQQQQQQQQSGGSHMLLVPPAPSTGGHQQQSLSLSHHSTSRNHHHQHQRPSAPTISPSTGTYSLDSSMGSETAKLLLNGPGQHQYRSGSMAATTTLCYQQPSQASIHQQQQQQQPNTAADYVRLAENSIPSRARLLPILDYVPNWSPSSGGTKILLIGHWTSLTSAAGEQAGQTGPCSSSLSSSAAAAANDDGLITCTTDDDNNNNNQVSPEMQQQQQQNLLESPSDTSASFFILFDDLAVPATLIQDNVLRCYSPHHEPGFIALKVLYKNLIVSEQVLFEVRPSGSEVAVMATAAATVTTSDKSAMAQATSAAATTTTAAATTLVANRSQA